VASPELGVAMLECEDDSDEPSEEVCAGHGSGGASSRQGLLVTGLLTDDVTAMLDML